MIAETRVWPCSTLAGNVHIRPLDFFLASLNMFINDCESIDFGVTNKFYQAGKFMDMNL